MFSLVYVFKSYSHVHPGEPTVDGGSHAEGDFVLEEGGDVDDHIHVPAGSPEEQAGQHSPQTVRNN